MPWGTLRWVLGGHLRCFQAPCRMAVAELHATTGAKHWALQSMGALPKEPPRMRAWHIVLVRCSHMHCGGCKSCSTQALGHPEVEGQTVHLPRCQPRCCCHALGRSYGAEGGFDAAPLRRTGQPASGRASAQDTAVIARLHQHGHSHVANATMHGQRFSPKSNHQAGRSLCPPFILRVWACPYSQGKPYCRCMSVRLQPV